MRALLIALFYISAAKAQVPCIDHLGAGKYPTELVQGHPSGYGVGVFTQKELFTDPLPALDNLVRTKQIPFIRYNLRWSDPHQFPKSDWPKIIAEARRVSAFILKNPSVGCYVSGATEHQLNPVDATDLMSQVLRVIPAHCKYVNNPWTGKGAFVPTSDRVINEVHGAKAQPPKIGGAFSHSFDGSDAFDVDVTAVKNRMRGAEFLCYWTSQNNGRRNAADSTPRPQRKFWPTVKLIQALAFLNTEQGNVKLPSNFLVKPKSDQHMVPPAPRELKPVLIFPRSGDRIELRGNGKTFVSMPGEPFVDGRTRYYFPIFGNEMVSIAKTNIFDAVKKVKKEVIEQGKKKTIIVDVVLGTTNPAFRQNGFR